jgi:hypothetical protein
MALLPLHQQKLFHSHSSLPPASSFFPPDKNGSCWMEVVISGKERRGLSSNVYTHCYLSIMPNCSVRKIWNLMVPSISKAWCCPRKACMVMPKTMMMICGTKETRDFYWGVCPGASYTCGSTASGHATFVLSQQAYTRMKKNHKA